MRRLPLRSRASPGLVASSGCCGLPLIYCSSFTSFGFFCSCILGAAAALLSYMICQPASPASMSMYMLCRLGIAVTWYCSLLLTSLNGWDGNKYLRCAPAIGSPPRPCGATCVACSVPHQSVADQDAHLPTGSRCHCGTCVQSKLCSSAIGIWTPLRRYRDLSYSIWGPFGFYATILFQQARRRPHLSPAAPTRSCPSTYVMCMWTRGRHHG